MNKAYDNLIKLAIKEDFKDPSDFLCFKKKTAGKLGIQPPTNADLRDHYERLVLRGTVRRSKKLEKLLLSKRIRTASGVAVVAVLTKPYPCPGKCLYCPSERNMPKSYLSNEPAVMRAIDAKFDPYQQVQRRLRALELNGHAVDKVELIVMGGTFSYLPKNYQESFISECFRACNDYGNKRLPLLLKERAGVRLEKEQKKNEKSKVRIVGLTLETRPDYIDQKEILNFRRLGCTRVELGVQSIFDDVLKINRRGCGREEIVRATRLLKDAGFKINYHMMPGLLGSTPEKDISMFRELFRNPDFQPDMLKIYPTIVNDKSELWKLWKDKKYKPLGNAAFEKMILEIKNDIIPPYVRIQRLIRDVPESEIAAGPNISNLRQIIREKSSCRCIRCREVGQDYESKERLTLNRIDYEASGVFEIFLEFISKPSLLDKERAGTRSGKLFALLRLRIPGSKNLAFPAFQKTAIIREVHTYGNLAKISQKEKLSPQHKGLGKRLIREAEKISRKEFGLRKIAVISGIGVRGYYRKMGYRLKDTYMVKSI